MTSRSILVVGAVAVLGAGCQEKSAKGSATSSAQGAPAASVVSGVAPGAGDRSGSSIANAKPLERGKPLDLVVPCKGATYVGPFTFTSDPQTIVVKAELSVIVDRQICSGGEWVDAQGTHVDGDGGIGCVEKPHPVKKDFTTLYSPGNGGPGVKVVYLRLAFPEPQPDGCDSTRVRLTSP